jgi:hypothetical protein
MLKSELNQVKDQLQHFRTSTTDLDQNSKQLERMLKEKEWELKDTLSLKDAR